MLENVTIGYTHAYQKFTDFLGTRNEFYSSERKTLEVAELIPLALEGESPELQNRILSEFNGMGPLESLLQRPDIDEIIVMGHDKIIYEAQGVLYPHSDIFLSERSFMRVLDVVSKSFFKAISYENPTGNGHWDHYRVHIIAPPLSPVYNLSLRKKGATKIKSLEQLIERQALTPPQSEVLQQLLVEKKNILVSGATSSGKTTFIQCMLNTLNHDRCLIIEDAQELDLPNTFSTRLLCPTREEQYGLSMSMSDLVKESLRMRPDRLILGEARGSEAKDYIQALSTGHRGCIASIHAAHPQEALLRLECLILQGAPEWSTKVVHQLMHSSIDYVIQLNKDITGRRHVQDIQRVSCLEEGHISLESLLL
ncbi:MAG: Flp pilus assembly complex ATPase component TadA [Bdellovibrionaceae bacterium]|nr:Flp pilus assembly complex ATPase component TadA [Pseudobdellovibrionaceae bacterium]